MVAASTLALHISDGSQDEPQPDDYREGVGVRGPVLRVNPHPPKTGPHVDPRSRRGGGPLADSKGGTT